MRTRVVGGEEGPDHELSALDRRDAAPDLLDHTAVLVAHRNGCRKCLNAAVRPQVGSADARGGQADDRVGGLNDGRLRAIFESDVARTVENSSLHLARDGPKRRDDLRAADLFRQFLGA